MSEPKLLDRMRNAIRVRQYSIATERTYLQLVRRFILFHGKRHPATMGEKETEDFLTYLAVDRGVAPSTQNVALASVLFLYRNVLNIELPWLDDVVRAKPGYGVDRAWPPITLNYRWLTGSDRIFGNWWAV